jgi:uncharacterized protein
MPGKFEKIFKTRKPVIAMVHFGALPGSPLHDAEAGLAGLLEGVRKDLKALQDAGVDAVMFGNENDRPYEFKVDAASTATMAYVIGQVRHEITVPFGVNVLWDPMATVALSAATGALRARDLHRHACLRHGNVASRCGCRHALPRPAGPQGPGADVQHLRRIRLVARPAQLARPGAECRLLLDPRCDPRLRRDHRGGRGLSDLEAVKRVVPDVPVLANTGVKHATVGDVLKIADGCVVGSSLKVDGNTWNAVDPARAKDFMDKARKARGE